MSMLWLTGIIGLLLSPSSDQDQEVRWSEDPLEAPASVSVGERCQELCGAFTAPPRSTCLLASVLFSNALCLRTLDYSSCNSRCHGFFSDHNNRRCFETLELWGANLEQLTTEECDGFVGPDCPKGACCPAQAYCEQEPNCAVESSIVCQAHVVCIIERYDRSCPFRY